MATALADQDAIFRYLVKTGRLTEFGKAAGLDQVDDYEGFKQSVPIRDYEQLKPWIEKTDSKKIVNLVFILVLYVIHENVQIPDNTALK